MRTRGHGGLTNKKLLRHIMRHLYYSYDSGGISFRRSMRSGLLETAMDHIGIEVESEEFHWVYRFDDEVEVRCNTKRPLRKIIVRKLAELSDYDFSIVTLHQLRLLIENDPINETERRLVIMMNNLAGYKIVYDTDEARKLTYMDFIHEGDDRRHKKNMTAFNEFKDVA